MGTRMNKRLFVLVAGLALVFASFNVLAFVFYDPKAGVWWECDIVSDIDGNDPPKWDCWLLDAAPPMPPDPE